MYHSNFGRRGIVSGAIFAVASLVLGQPALVQPALAQAPKAPLVINVVDVGGALALLQDAIEAYNTKNPTYVSRFTFTKAPAPELPGKLKAMQAANRADIELVLGGLDILSAGIEQGLWEPILPGHADKFPNVKANYLPAAAKMQELAKDQALAVVFMPAGPLVEYNPAKVKEPPTSPAALLAWCKANPNKLVYARPANSGPGRTFLMGLPYMLGDKDPKDPVNGWEKTWSYLSELGKYVDYYPKGTTDTMKNLANGSSTIIASTTGWDINPRVLGTVPAGMKTGTLQGFHWVTDAHYAVIPKGVPSDVLAADLALIKWILQPNQQAKAYDKGFFYPGPAVKDVTLDMAPQESKDALAKFGRPEYEKLIADNPKETSLPAQQQVAAFQKWDREVGSGKTK
jgi:putative spermidine/putrescine transport system substrate-binding protein